MTESSGTPDNWTPARWPADAAAADELREWIDQRREDAEAAFYGMELDFRGADLSDADFTESWLSGADLRGVRLQRMSLYRGHAERADFSGADMEGADLVRASLWDANFTGARLAHAVLRRAEALDAVFVNADLTGVEFGDGDLGGSDLTGADFTGAHANGLGLMRCRFDHTTVTGFSGFVIGPIIVSEQGKDAELDNDDLDRWFAEHGATATRFHAPPHRPRQQAEPHPC